MSKSAPVFPDWGAPLRDATNAAIDALIVRHGDTMNALADSLLTLLVPAEAALRAAPAWGVIVGTGVLAWLAGRTLRVAALAAGGLWFIGALGQWDLAMQSLALVLVAVLVSVALGLPLGVWSARSPWVRRMLTPLLDLMQTIPSFVYLIPAAMLFGLGKVPAILATVIYAAPPLIRLTELGLRQVEKESIQAARAFGATRWQILTKVQMPLSLPSIMQGLNQTTMMALGMVVIASMIGARGVGETVLTGLQRNDPGTGLVGGLVIVALAVVLDRTMQAWGERAQRQRGLGGR